MTYPLCGNCLHAKSSHIRQNGLFYCSCCYKLCEQEEYELKHEPTNIKIVYEIGAKKQ